MNSYRRGRKRPRSRNGLKVRVEERCNPVCHGGLVRHHPCRELRQEALRERRQDAYAAQCEAEANVCRFVLNGLRRELNQIRSELGDARFALHNMPNPHVEWSASEAVGHSDVRSVYRAKPVGEIAPAPLTEIVPADVIRLPTKVYVSNLGSLIDILA